MNLRTAGWLLFGAIYMIGCGDVHFTKPVPAENKLPLRPATPPREAVTIHEAFVQDRESGTLLVTFALFPSATGRDLWTPLRKNIDHFVERACVELAGFDRIYVGLALDASQDVPRPGTWFYIPRGECLLRRVADNLEVDLREETSALEKSARLSRSGVFKLFDAFGAWVREANSLGNHRGPVWNHIVYVRDRRLDPTGSDLRDLQTSRRGFLASLAPLGADRQSFSLYATPGEEAGLARQLSATPFTLLNSYSIARWMTADLRTLENIVFRLKAQTSRVILGRVPVEGSVQVRIDGRPPLSKNEVDVDGTHVTIRAGWPKANDPIEVEYATP